MGKPNQSSMRKSNTWKFLFAINIFILFLFWFFVLTDYSWYDNWISISFSILALMTSLAIFIMLNFLSKFRRFLVFLVCLLTFFIAFATIPLHRYHSHEIPAQVAASPDSTKLVEVYCAFTQAHVTGFDYIEIIVRNNRAPFLQRDLGLYNNYSPRHCIGDMGSLVQWKSNTAIYVVERKAYLQVGFIKWDGLITNPGEINGDN